MLDIIYGEITSLDVAELTNTLRRCDIEGTLYLGYPVLVGADTKIFVDAMLVSPQIGLVAFDVSHAPDDLDALREHQDQIYALLYNKLNAIPELRSGRRLAFEISVLTVSPTIAGPIADGNVVVVRPRDLPQRLATLDSIRPELIRPLNAAIQRISTLRPQNKRISVTRENSRGGVLRQIGKEIANLDTWQKRAAIEYANGPQRIRGLAGSGKTVVLALKAAYLHARHPEWQIAVTFWSRSLYQQFRDLIRRFSFAQIDDEPDWTRLHILHAWGSRSSSGVYSSICSANGLEIRDFSYAHGKYGSNKGFEGVCSEALAELGRREAKALFDAVLIDEAQDLPGDFFKLVYRSTEHPKRIIWAYDDLQNLGDYQMPAPEDLFGRDSRKLPLISLRNDDSGPKQDIVLPVCYRNTPWALTVAHALGFGIYRPEGVVQMFAEPSLWERIGYRVSRGNLGLGQHVRMVRGEDTYPRYFPQLLQPDDAVKCECFDREEEQYEALAESVSSNLGADELEPSDILIIIPNTYTSRSTGARIMQHLQKHRIRAHLVGVTSSRDLTFAQLSVALTHIYRAKGNEAPMVYVVNSDYCQQGFETARKRNILFTAITRSQCWVRVMGVGPRIRLLRDEVEAVRAHRYELEFDYPTAEQITALHQVHADVSEEERAQIEAELAGVGNLLQRLKRGEISISSLPPDVQELARIVNR